MAVCYPEPLSGNVCDIMHFCSLVDIFLEDPWSDELVVVVDIEGGMFISVGCVSEATSERITLCFLC